MITDKELSYAAGIIDGEGCISIAKRKDGKYSWYQDSIRVHMKHKDVPSWMQEKFGGKLYERHEPRTAYVWQLWGLESRALLFLLKPYIVEKQEQIKLFLAMGKLKESSRRFQKDPPYTRKRKLEIYKKLRKIHAS